MSKFVAIDVGRDSCRFLLAEVERGKVQVLQDGTVKVAHASDDGPPHKQLGQELAGQIEEFGGAGAAAIVSICRADIEVQSFDLPPATDAELASLLEIQLLGETGGANDPPVIDFVPRKGESTEPRQVEAIIATSRTVSRYEALCAEAGVKLRRLVVRPYATAHWKVPSVGKTDDAVSLLVSLLEDEIDLVVTDAEEVFYWRTVQVAGPDAVDQEHSAHSDPDQTVAEQESPVLEMQPTSAPNAPSALAAEIARTLAVASSCLPEGKLLEQVVLFGLEEGLAGSVASELKLSDGQTRVVDPRTLPGVDAGGDENLRWPEFATSLLAMLMEEAEGRTPAVDLLHPRKPPAPLNRRRIVLMAVAAIVLMMLVGGEWVSSLQMERDARLRAIGSRVTELRKDEKKLASQVAMVRSIAAWNASGIVWLDELRDLSIRFPPANDVTVRSMSFSPLRTSGAMIRVNGMVRDPTVVVRMDDDLRDPVRNATSTNYREQGMGGASGQKWRFETVITTGRRSAKAYAESMAASASGLDGQVAAPETLPSTESAEARSPETAPSENQKERPTEGSSKVE